MGALTFYSAERLQPARPEGVELGELEAMVRRALAEELRPMQEALARIGMAGTVPGSPVGSMRERRPQRRSAGR
jgi:hypothetical protein